MTMTAATAPCGATIATTTATSHGAMTVTMTPYVAATTTTRSAVTVTATTTPHGAMTATVTL